MIELPVDSQLLERLIRMRGAIEELRKFVKDVKSRRQITDSQRGALETPPRAATT